MISEMTKKHDQGMENLFLWYVLNYVRGVAFKIKTRFLRFLKMGVFCEEIKNLIFERSKFES